MDVWTKSIILGLTLSAFCVLVESMGFCKFRKMFPPKEREQLIKNDTLKEDKGKSEANKSQSATTTGQSLTVNVTMTRQEISPTMSQTFPQTFFDNYLEETTHELKEVHGVTSPATAERATSPGSDCSFEYTRKLNNACYKFVDSSPGTTRRAAQTACRDNCSHLVFIETKEENDFLVKEAGGNTQYWIGIHQRPNLFWDNGNEVTFANIDPDNKHTFSRGTGCYRMFRNGERYWFDSHCSIDYGYICEYEGDECKSGFNKKFNNSCYKFVDSGANRSYAQSACEDVSSHLVFIETKEENDFLVGEAGSNTEYWIGIHKRPHLFWDNGNEVTFANIDHEDWRTFNDHTGCYRMSNNEGRHWFESNCSALFSYICECEGVSCPSGYDNEFESASYKFVHATVAMSDARSACKADSTHLVFIGTKEENDFLVREAGNNTQYWIGIHERPNLFWDNGSQVTFANIDPDDRRTFNEGADCYRMSLNRERYWFDGSCSKHYGYICECEGADCRSGYNKKLQNSSYKFVHATVTMSEARSACKADSSHLVFIETKEENDFLVREAGSNSEFWIGIHERPNLFWDNGNQVTFAKIGPDDWRTFDEGTDCYRMTDNEERHWSDGDCSVRHGYICEYKCN